jgi:hypothetical protein
MHVQMKYVLATHAPGIHDGSKPVAGALFPREPSGEAQNASQHTLVAILDFCE